MFFIQAQLQFQDRLILCFVILIYDWGNDGK